MSALHKGATFVADVKSTGLFMTDPVLKQNGAKARSRQMADAVLKDIVKLGETYDVEAVASLRSEKDADDATNVNRGEKIH